VKNASDYLAHIKALITLNRQVLHWMIVREEAQGDVGLFRYRLILRDGNLLELFERFQIAEERLQVAKYSFHWQDGTMQHTIRRCRHTPTTFTMARRQMCFHTDRSAPKRYWLSSQRKQPTEGAI
jgi:hypothetical protein